MSLTVVTPSHAPDVAGFARLHTSVVRNTDTTVRHLVVVPDADVDLFESLDTGRLDVRGYRNLLPRNLRSTTRIARLPGLPRGYRIGAVNTHRPWPPIRGWILQQIVKLAAVSELTVDVALLIDSDVVVIRPLQEFDFRSGDAVRLYHSPGGIAAGMSRHQVWTRTAAELVAADVGPTEATTDYISAFGSWSPAIVRECLARVESTTRMSWHDALSMRLQFSEFILYGTYATRVADPTRIFLAERSLCHSYWTPTALDLAGAEDFVARTPDDDVAIHIQSNSGTSDDVINFALGAFVDRS